MKARNLQLENDLNKMRSVVKQQQEELKTSVDNVLNLSGELREKGVEMAQVEEQNLLYVRSSALMTKWAFFCQYKVKPHV